MQVLVIGSGAREHALGWKLSQDPRVTHIFAAPGNPGIAKHARCLSIAATECELLAAWAERHHIDVTIVGPEAPLTNGIGDAFRRRGLRIYGPGMAGAMLES